MNHRFGIPVVLTIMHAACLVATQEGPKETQPFSEKTRQAVREGKIAYELPLRAAVVHISRLTHPQRLRIFVFNS